MWIHRNTCKTCLVRRCRARTTLFDPETFFWLRRLCAMLFREWIGWIGVWNGIMLWIMKTISSKLESYKFFRRRQKNVIYCETRTRYRKWTEQKKKNETKIVKQSFCRGHLHSPYLLSTNSSGLFSMQRLCVHVALLHCQLLMLSLVKKYKSQKHTSSWLMHTAHSRVMAIAILVQIMATLGLWSLCRSMVGSCVWERPLCKNKQPTRYVIYFLITIAV